MAQIAVEKHSCVLRSWCDKPVSLRGTVEGSNCGETDCPEKIEENQVVLYNSESDFIRRFSQNCEKRLSAPSCPPVRLHGTTPLPLDGFSRNFVFYLF